MNYLTENKETFHRLFGIREIGLFGSFARGEQTDTSDIDILIDMESETENIFEKRLLLKELLAGRFGRNVDVCHERAIKSVFREFVLKDVIYV